MQTEEGSGIEMWSTTKYVKCKSCINGKPSSKMARDLGRTKSILDLSTVKEKRCLEVFAFGFPAVLLVVGTVSYLLANRMGTSNVDYMNSTTNNAVNHTDAPTLDRFCTKTSNQYMENITDNVTRGVFTDGSLQSKDGTVYPAGMFWTSENGTTWGCPCLFKHCLYKCCGKGEILQVVSEYENSTDYDYQDNKEIEKYGFCAPHNESFHPKKCEVYSKLNSTHLEKLFLKEDHFFVIYGGCKGRHSYMLSEEENKNAYLLEDGKLINMDDPDHMWGPDEFCAESSPESSARHFMICLEKETIETVEEEESKWVDLLSGSSMLVSVPFLFATVVVYALGPSLQNIHGKALMCYVTSLTLAYSGLALIKLAPNCLPSPLCKCVAFLIQFFLLTGFFWLNIMCFDIWWVFSGLMPCGVHKDAEQTKFLRYSLYAWGCPIAILTFTLIMEYAPFIPDTAIKPEMGDRCFFKEDDARLLYLYLPIGVLVYLNMVMFITTSLHFKSHSKSAKRLKRGDSRRNCHASKAKSEKQRFNIYMKLFLVMGFNWVLDLLSFIMKSTSLFWLIVDVSNAFHGIFIFYMFVCKRRILLMLKQRIWPDLANNSCKTISSARTKVPSLCTEYQCVVNGAETTV